jgi:diguanylate cyclase (GGDEF)-like protein
MSTTIAPGGVKSTILIVEDEAGIARMIQVLLEARGFATMVCHTGDAALRLMMTQPADLVLLDVMMPGMDGYEVCRRLKADPQWRHIPVVMLTAKDTTRDLVRGLETGADDYITKPFNTEELIARIQVLLRVRGMSVELMRRNRELQSLNAVALAVNRSLSPEAILDGAVGGIIETLGLAAGWVHLLDSGGGHLTLHAWRGVEPSPPDALRSLAPGGGRTWAALEGSEPSLFADARGVEGLDTGDEADPQPCGLIPLRFQDRKLGVFTVLGQRGQQFSREDAGLLASIGRQVSIALENARLYAETQRKAREFEALYQVSRTMASTLDSQKILTQISETVPSLLQAQAMSLVMLGPDGRTPATVAGYNLFDEALPRAADFRGGASPSLVATREKRPVTVSDIRQDERYGAWLAAGQDRGFNAFLAVPLVVQDRALGCMNLYFVESHEFGSDEIQLLSTFASQAAVSIENARLYEEAKQLAITDPLTGLANHRQFYDQLEREFRRAQRYQRPLTLLMLDLDRFKTFNDRYGHLAGDQALRETADVLRQNARSVDILARYGGEEFAIILPETDLARAASHAERIRVAVADHVFLSQETGLEHRVTVSIGLAALSPASQKIEELVHDADQALYRAKAAGRNRLELAASENGGTAPA